MSDALERTVSLLRATLESTADGLLVVDRSGAIAAYNQRFLELWRIPAAQVDQADFEELLQVGHAQLKNGEACLERVRDLAVQPEAESFDSLQFHDGRFFERYSRPQRIGAQIIGRVWSYRDVTERELLLRRAQEALVARDEFLSVAAHEIRGPLTSLRLAVEGLQLAPPAPVAARMMEIIRREDQRLARLVDELLDAARIRAGQLRFTFAPVDLVAVTRAVAGRLALDLSRSGSVLTLTAPEALVGVWDGARLDQMVGNLLSNAIKFGQGQPITIVIERSGETARLVVRDRGVGVSAEAQRRIFAPFERVHSEPHYGGLGLGLYIVRTLVDGLGGQVRVESEPAAGATFTVELPLARPA